MALTNTYASVGPVVLPFFDSSVKRIELPQPSPARRTQRSPCLDNTLLNVHLPHRRSTQRLSHSRTASSDASRSPAAQNLWSRHFLGPANSLSAQCYTPEASRSPSPTEFPPMEGTPMDIPTLTPRSPPLTPPTIHANFPPSVPVSNYRLRLEPISTSEPPQAVVVFPDAAAPTRALLLLGPAIAKHMRERGTKAMRMHPYRVVLRPSV